MTSFQIYKSNRLHVYRKKNVTILVHPIGSIEFVIGKIRDYLSIHKFWYHYKIICSKIDTFM